MTFSKIEWLTLIDAMKENYKTYRGLENSLNVVFDCNGIQRLFDCCLDMLIDSFFDDDDIKIHVSTLYRSGTDEKKETFKFNYETVTEAVLYWTCTADFGEQENFARNMMQVSDKDGNIIKSYHCYTSEDLYDMIYAFVYREQHPEWSYSLYLSTVDRTEEYPVVDKTDET